MARSKPPRPRPCKPAPVGPTKAQRARRNRLLASSAEILRNLGVVFIGGPVIEPFINPGEPFNTLAGIAAVIVGIALLAASLILDAIRTDDR